MSLPESKLLTTHDCCSRNWPCPLRKRKPQAGPNGEEAYCASKDSWLAKKGAA